ncbi:hypothetical protein GCM10009716_17520 [Streptomyces sodiiphilus]|uniref:JmjC domain-containing protein n=1 Tax=Streptomyces sodiiphilus TaxID=226217 RepID=A0ABN2NZI5_9ACTN
MTLVITDTLDWDTFAEQHWDRRPVLFKAVAQPPFREDEVFRAAVLATRPPAPRVMAPTTQFTIGRDQQTEPGTFLPREADGSLDGYAKRMTEELDGRRHALVVHAFHAFHAPQWDRERRFCSGLWRRVGLPVSGAITTLFHGNYEHSPVGVHKDRFATFMFALRGRKRMRFWPTCPWSEPVSSMLDYQHLLETSFTAEAEPGDLLYWPADYYHVGESDLSSEPATSVNIGVPRTGHRADYDIPEFLYDPTPYSLVTGEADPGALPPVAGALLMDPALAGARLGDRLPPGLEEALETYRRAGDEQRVRERTAVLSLRKWTADGVQPVPPPAPVRALADTDRVRALAPVRWTDCPPVRLCGALGHVTRTPLPAEALGRLVTRLAEGTPAGVGDLVPAGAQAPDGPDDAAHEDGAAARRLLEELESFRALERLT